MRSAAEEGETMEGGGSPGAAHAEPPPRAIATSPNTRPAPRKPWMEVITKCPPEPNHDRDTISQPAVEGKAIHRAGPASAGLSAPSPPLPSGRLRPSEPVIGPPQGA